MQRTETRLFDIFFLLQMTEGNKCKADLPLLPVLDVLDGRAGVWELDKPREEETRREC